MTLKDKVIQLCEERGMTVRQLEREAGLKERTIQHWDKSDPSGEKLYKVAKALNVPIEAIYAAYDPTWQRIADAIMARNSVNEIASKLSDREYRLLRIFRILNDDGQDKVVEYANVLADVYRFKRFTDEMYLDDNEDEDEDE